MGKVGEIWVEIGARMDKFNKGMTDAQNAMTKIGNSLSKVGRNLTMKVTLPLVALGAIAVKVGADFEQAMMNAASVSGATADEMKLMEKVARDMGATTVFSAKQAADAMYFMASAGWKAYDMAKAIKPTLDLAAATQSDLAFATDTVVASLNQFQLGSEGASRLSNVFAAAIGNSQATMEKLSISMRYVGPIFNSMGKSVEEATSVLMALYNAGIDASMAGTALRMGMVKLMDGTKKTTDALARLNLSLKEVDPTTHNFADIIELLGKRGAKTKDIMDIFGVRAGPAFAALIAQGGDALRKFEKEITGTDAAARMAEMQIGTLKGSLKLLTSALTEAAIQIFKILGPAIKDLVDNKLKPAVQWFSKLSEGTKATILKVGGLTAAAGPLLLVFGKILTIIPKIGLALKALTGPIGLVVAGIIGLAKAVLDNDKAIRNAERNWTEFEKSLGRIPVFETLIRKAKQFGLSLDEFMLRLIKNKNDVIKTLDELAAGEIKNTKDLQVLHNRIIKEKEDIAKREKEIAKDIHRLAEIEKADAEARTKSIKAQKTAYFALNGDLESYLKWKDEENVILGKTNKERKEEAKKLEEVNKGYGLAYTALNEVNSALKNSKNLTIEQKEQLENTRNELDDYINSIKGAKTANVELGETAIDVSSNVVVSINWWKAELISLDELMLNVQENIKNGFVETAIPAARDFSDVLGLVPDKFEDIEFSSEEASGEVKKDWKEAFSMLGSILQVFADSVGGLFGNFVSTIGLALDQIGDDFKRLKAEGKSTGTALLESIGPVLAGKIGGAFGQMVSGAKESFASLGASIGSAIALIPGIGTAAGIAISALGGFLGGLFGKGNKEAEEAAAAAKKLEHAISALQTTLSRYGEVSDETAKKIHESSKALGGFAAVSKHFADVIKDTGVTQENINDLWWRAGEILGHYQRGFLSASDAAQAANDSFGLLLEGAKKIGEEGSAAMVDFILKTRQSGLEVASVTEYVVDQLDRIPDALSSIAENIPSITPEIEKTQESISGLQQEIQELQVEQSKLNLDTKEGQERYQEIQEEIQKYASELKALKSELAGYMATQSQYAAENEDDLQRLGTLALHTFNSMIASGVSWGEAVSKMADPLIVLRNKYEELGLTADPALKKLFEIVGVTEANKELFEAIDANRTIMEALGNSGWMTGDILNSFAQDAIANYEELKKKFGNSDDALRAMGPTLQKIKDYAEAYNITLDEGTQNLIDQAVKIGAVKKAQEDSVETQERLFKEFGDRMGKIMNDVGDRIVGALEGGFGKAFGWAEEAAGETATTIGDALSEITPVVDIGFDYELPDFSNIKGNVDLEFSGGKGIGGFQQEAIVSRPTLAWIGERRPEAVVDIAKFQAGTSRFSGVLGEPAGIGRRERPINIPIYVTGVLDSTNTYKVIIDKVIPEIERALRSNVGGFTRLIKKETGNY